MSTHVAPQLRSWMGTCKLFARQIWFDLSRTERAFFRLCRRLRRNAGTIFPCECNQSCRSWARRDTRLSDQKALVQMNLQLTEVLTDRPRDHPCDRRG